MSMALSLPPAAPAKSIPGRAAASQRGSPRSGRGWQLRIAIDARRRTRRARPRTREYAIGVKVFVDDYRHIGARGVAFSPHANVPWRRNACALGTAFPNIHSSFPLAKRKTLTDEVRQSHAADVPPDDGRRRVPHALGEPGAVPGYTAFGRRSSLATPDRKTFRRVERRDARKVTRFPFRSRRPVRTSGVFARAAGPVVTASPLGRACRRVRGMCSARQRPRADPGDGTVKRRSERMDKSLQTTGFPGGRVPARMGSDNDHDRTSARGSGA
jgi:hypothetical protein